jgi:hypothetical protein
MVNFGALVTEPSPLQKGYIEDCLNPAYQYVAASCGLQSGKTYAECDGGFLALYSNSPIMLPEKIRGKIPMEVWLISRNYSQAEVLFDTFKSRTPPELWASDRQIRDWGLTRGDKNTHWLVPRAKSGDPLPIKLLTRTASDPDSLRATNKLGLAICDELAHWKPMAWNNLQARGIVVKTKFLIATSPKGKNFFYRSVAVPGGYTPGQKGRHQKQDAKISLHTWTSEDNPHADAEHIERLRRLFGREYARQELDGMFTEQVGYVYGTFDRSMMVDLPSQDPEDYDLITAGIDFGWTDPYAGCVWGRSKLDGRWYQLEEIHCTQSTDEDVAPDLISAQSKWNVPKWYCDKRFPSNISRLRKLGVRAYANVDIHAENDRRTIPVMLAVCQGLMQSDKIRIRKDHEWTAEEFENYHYGDPSEDNPKNTNDIPVDWSNHHMDAMRYALCSVLDISHSAPRYRKGPSLQPQEVTPKGPKILIPTFAQSMAFQDEKMDQAADRAQGKSRRAPFHQMRTRSKFREGLI